MSHKICLAINHAKPVLLPEEGAKISFQSFERSTKASFMIYDYVSWFIIVINDFECVLIPSTDNISFGQNT